MIRPIATASPIAERVMQAWLRRDTAWRMVTLHAANNLLVYAFGMSPLGTPMKVIGAEISPLAGFVIVGFSCLVTLAVALLPVASRILRSWRTSAHMERHAAA